MIKGKKTDKRIELQIKLTRQELADLIGTTQESLIRLITEFKAEQLILTEGKMIILYNLPRLVEIANLLD